jgi:hypothetical protein
VLATRSTREKTQNFKEKQNEKYENFSSINDAAIAGPFWCFCAAGHVEPVGILLKLR